MWESKNSNGIDLKQFAMDTTLRSQAVSFAEISFPIPDQFRETEARIVEEEFDDIDLELFDAKQSKIDEIEQQQGGS